MLLNLKHLKNKYNLKVSNIVHVGAHKGQEVNEYLNIFPQSKIHLFEPQIDLFKNLENKFSNIDNISLYNFALGSSKLLSAMFVSSNEGESSSFYKPKEHLNLYPDIKFKKSDLVYEIKVLDKLKIKNIDFLNIDTQGFELEVLKGAVEVLEKNAKYLLVEINTEELYKGAPLVKDLDSFLRNYDFIRTDTQFWAEKDPWGDAFYIKKDCISFNRYVYSVSKNSLYGIKVFFTVLIYIRNIFWKLKKAFREKKF